MVFNSENVRLWSMIGPSGTFGMAAHELAEHDPDFVVLTADLCSFSGLNKVWSIFPDRVINVGIAEQNMLGIAAGMANEGMRVWATSYASFASTRALDQVKVNMGYMKLPVHLVGFSSGYSIASLGATHMSVEDIAIMRSIPNIVVLSPADCTELMKAILVASTLDSPIYIRAFGTMRIPVVYKEDYAFQIGKAVKLRDGNDVSIIATGSMVYIALQSAEKLSRMGISVEVLDMHTIKPIDTEAILNGESKKIIVTLEEHNRLGGLGAAVAEILASHRGSPPLLILGAGDFYPHANASQNLLKDNGLSVDGVVGNIRDFLETGIKYQGR